MAPQTNEGDNIHVLLRIRPRNNREIKDNSSVCLSASSDGKQVHIKHQNDLIKTFTFDRVFGQGSSQQSVFDAIHPMIKEVFLGYNCTIFAYGQTGAGKTWTMEGDLATSSQDAGIIPRTLFALFDQLERDVAEYSVRVSYLELYNEELKDLLAVHGSEGRKLKLFEDLARKGSIVVQGAEEILVKCAQDVISILQTGSMKRQIAATKMNDVSSRSHGIFTITVHIKESTSDGEELLKVGKLHLVDLAGSENIGRSGAEKGRAKEAGMINQSLLTLGRVINALVERSPHIPYRESKLTRILQDSLGGRTKTCIIANISPARDSIEETLSTLDYAHRAKNIRNKPEVNQKMTKRALIRDYATQIERLKSDLLATREKNGIFLSPESYESLMSENSGNRTHIEEVSKMLEVKQQEFKLIQATFLEQSELLNNTSTKLDDAMTDLEEKRAELEDLMSKTKELQVLLDQQVYITSAHAKTESELNQLASGLVQTLNSSVNDIDGLYQKIERKSAIERENREIFNEFQGELFAQFKSMASTIAQYQNRAAEISNSIRDEDRGFSGHLERLALVEEGIVKKANEHNDSLLEAVHSRSETLHAVLVQLLEEFKERQQNWAMEYRNTSKTLISRRSQEFSTLEALLQSQAQQLMDQLQSMTKCVSSVFSNCNRFLRSTLELEHDHHQKQVQALTAELNLIKAENEQLRRQQFEDQAEFKESQVTFMDEIQKRFQDYTDRIAQKANDKERVRQANFDRQYQSIEAIMERAQADNILAATNLSTFGKDVIQKHSEEFGGVNKNIYENIDDSLLTVLGEVKSIHETISQNQQNTDQELMENQNAIEHLQEFHIQRLQEKISDDRQKLKLIANEGFSNFGACIENAFGLNSEIELFLKSIRLSVKSLEGGCDSHVFDMGRSLEECHSVLQGNSLRQDVSTGKTPRKKSIQVPSVWNLTKPHGELISEFNEKENDQLVSVPATPSSKLPQFMTRKRNALQELE